MSDGFSVGESVYLVPLINDSLLSFRSPIKKDVTSVSTAR